DLLCCDAFERAQAGDLAGAVAACHAAFHTGCSIGDEPTAISQIFRALLQSLAVTTLERVLAQGEPPADLLATLQARIEAEEPAPLLLYALRSERAMRHRMVESLRNGTLSPAHFGSVGATAPTVWDGTMNAVEAAFFGGRENPLALMQL